MKYKDSFWSKITNFSSKKAKEKNSPEEEMPQQNGKVKISLSFQKDVTDLNQRLELNMENKPSWVLEILGLNSTERDLIRIKFDRLRRPPNEDWIPAVTPLFDIHDGDLTEFHDVSPFFDVLKELEYKPSSKNPPPNTNGFQPKEVREWHFTK